ELNGVSLFPPNRDGSGKIFEDLTSVGAIQYLECNQGHLASERNAVQRKVLGKRAPAYLIASPRNEGQAFQIRPAFTWILGVAAPFGALRAGYACCAGA